MLGGTNSTTAGLWGPAEQTDRHMQTHFNDILKPFSFRFNVWYEGNQQVSPMDLKDDDTISTIFSVTSITEILTIVDQLCVW